MGNKKDVLPIVMASAVALVITGIVRWMLPGGTIIKQQPLKKELSTSDIPLMIKSEQKKVKEIQVLVTSAEIKKDERIIQGKLSWRSWPANAVQPYFIAQDSKGNPLNNRTDYANALNMWAKNEIPAGMPLTLSMLTSNDPVEIARKKKEAEEAEKAKKLTVEKKKKESETFIKVGYRAVPFQVDQRTPISKSMISPGDYIDVIINSFEGNQQKTHVYKALKIIAIDGVMKPGNVEKDPNSGGLFGGGIGFGSSTPKNITLEVKESLVNTMLKQAGNNGITVTLRSKDEGIDDTFEEEEFEEENHNQASANNNLIKSIWEMSRSSSSAEILKESAKKRQEEERNISALLHNMNSFSLQATPKNKGEANLSSEDSSKYEVVSGRIVSESDKKKEEEKDEPVKIYRKLTPDEVQFYKNGKRVKGGDIGMNGSMSDEGSRK